MTLAPERQRPATSVPHPDGARATFIPVKFWAVLGVLCLGVFAYTWTVWFADGKATPTPTGPTEVPWWTYASIRTWEVVGMGAMVVAIYFFLVKPWRRDGRISSDGILLLAFVTLYFQDPLLNYFVPVFSYNSAVVINLGNWDGVPGLAHAERPLHARTVPDGLSDVHLQSLFAWVVLSNVLMRWAQTRWPLARHDRPGHLGLRLHPGVRLPHRGLDLLPARAVDVRRFDPLAHLQLREVLPVPAQRGDLHRLLVCTVWTLLRGKILKDDRGLTFAERGVDTLKASPKQKTALRFLALVGVCNVMLYFCYNLPMGLVGMQADPWPKDVLRRSYFTNGICGPGTSYACPGPDDPLARPRSFARRPQW